MSQNSQFPGKFDLDSEAIKAIIQQQSQKLQIEANRLKLDQKKLELDSQLSEKAMQINSEILKKSPSEHRKTVALYSLFILLLIILLLSFILFCLQKGKDDFVNKFLNWVGHIIGIAAGYFVGRTTTKKKNSSNQTESIQMAEIVDQKEI